MYYSGQLPGRLGFKFTKSEKYAIIARRCLGARAPGHRKSNTKGAEGGNGKGTRERPFALSIVSLHTNP
jgi:hypothetical protein